MAVWVLGLLLSGCVYPPFEKYNELGLPATQNNSPYFEYYQSIRKKIYHYSNLNYTTFEQGNVFLKFDILQDGKVANIEFDKEKTKTSDKLIKAAMNAVKMSSPFPPLPEGLNKSSKINFALELSFEFNENPSFGGYVGSAKCPSDGQEMKEVPIVYGNSTPKLLQRSAKGEIILGGTFERKGSPKVGYVCPKCRKMWLMKK